MIKLLLLIALVWIAFALVKGYARKTSKPKAATQQDMVRCAYCATYIPKIESVRAADERDFCSDEHRRLAEKA